MPAPNVFDLTKPADADQLSIGAAQIRTDKTTLSKVLVTLAAFGTTTVGWRQVQVNNITYLTTNAFFDGTNWQRDDTTLDSFIIASNPVAGGGTSVEFIRVAAAANPIGVSLPTYVFHIDPGNIFGAVPVNLPADPTTPLQSSTKQYVDTRADVMPNLIASFPKL